MVAILTSQSLEAVDGKLSTVLLETILQALMHRICITAYQYLLLFWFMVKNAYVKVHLKGRKAKQLLLRCSCMTNRLLEKPHNEDEKSLFFVPVSKAMAEHRSLNYIILHTCTSPGSALQLFPEWSGTVMGCTGRWWGDQPWRRPRNI